MKTAPCEPLECRTLLSVTISTPAGPDTIELADVNGALVVTIDGKATYRLHSDVTIIGSGNDTIRLGNISESVTVTTAQGDSTTIIESQDNPLTLDGAGNAVIDFVAGPEQTNLPALRSPLRDDWHHRPRRPHGAGF